MGRRAGHESETLVKAIGALTGGAAECPLLLHCARVCGKGRVCTELAFTAHRVCWHLDLGFPSLRTVRNKCLSCVPCPV